MTPPSLKSSAHQLVESLKPLHIGAVKAVYSSELVTQVQGLIAPYAKLHMLFASEKKLCDFCSGSQIRVLAPLITRY